MKKLLVISMILGIGQIAAASKEEPAFDWLRINPIYSFDTFDWTQLPAGFTQEMADALRVHPNADLGAPITILPFENQIYALTPCKLDVLRWNQGKWENVYKGYAAGFNCMSDFFIRDGKLYSYGKYGFWQAHSELLNFNFSTGYWENLPARNQPSYYKGFAAFNTAFGLLTFLGNYLNQSSGLDILEENGYFYDFKNQSWHPLTLNLQNYSRFSNNWDDTFELKDFGLFLHNYQAQRGVILLNKRDITLWFKRIEYAPVGNYSLAYAHNNEIWFFNEKQEAAHYNFDDNALNSFNKVGEVIMDEGSSDISTPSKNWNTHVIFLLSLAVLGLGGYAIILQIKIKARPAMASTHSKPEEALEEESNGDIDLLIRRLIPYANQFVTVDTLDELLGITHIDNPDYRKVKRSRLVRAINAVCKEKKKATLIERKRLPHDKRLVQYKIYGK